MIIVITRDGKCAGISAVVGSVDTRILTESAGFALREDLKALSIQRSEIEDAITQHYRIEVTEEDGSRRSYLAPHDPDSPWSTPLKRILNRTGMAGII